MRHAIQQVHFIGIGGAGMSGIAKVLLHMGYRISGSDLVLSPVTDQLADLGIRLFEGHHDAHIAGADVVVVSSAIENKNPELQAARQQGIPIVPRALMLAELMRTKRGIAVAGAHGKTTTTSLVASVLAQAGLDPSYVIGGVLSSTGDSASLGKSEFIVVEADESDASFLNLLPTMAIITNIDADHMETYGHDWSRLKTAFLDFLHRMPFYGPAIVCSDDLGVQEILPQIARPVITYGLEEDAQVRAIEVRAVHHQMHFTVQRRHRNRNGQHGQHSQSPSLPDLPIQLNLVGVHNVRNALAAIALATELEIADSHIQAALLGFKGVGRRFQRYGPLPLSLPLPLSGSSPHHGEFVLIDDYGHHPLEIAVTLEAARQAYPGQRIVLAFQPHRYTRTRDCFEEFVRVLSTADVLLLSQVYAAGEAPIVAADGQALARAIRVTGQVEPIFVEDIAHLPGAIWPVIQDGDVVLCMGAGSMSQVPAWVIEQTPRHDAALSAALGENR
jgi:UDP-N-acetylmuramate--alanine ligase